MVISPKSASAVELAARFEEYGFIVVPELVDPPAVERVKTPLTALMSRRGEDGSPGAYVRALLNQLEPEDRKPVEELVAHPLLLDLGKIILGEDFHIAEIGARWMRPGTKGLPLHIGVTADDLGGESSGKPIPCAVLTFSWLLTDMTLDNGPRFFMPFSHHSGRPPREGEDYPDLVRIEAPAGSLIAFNSAVWHGFEECAEDDSQSRLELCSGYAVPEVDPAAVGWQMIDPVVLETCSEAVKKRSR